MIRIHYFYELATAPIRHYFMDFEDVEKEYAKKFSNGMTDRGFCITEEVTMATK